MKNNKGITLISLIIYVIAMTIVIGIIATLTSFFYKNINIEDINNDTTQFTKFSSIFLDEINKEKNIIIDCKTSLQNGLKVSYIVFSSGNQYTFKSENNCIYKNKIKICNNINDCDFSYLLIDSKYEIKVNFRTEDINMTGENAMVYTISNYY